jgi:hypothetical protein
MVEKLLLQLCYTVIQLSFKGFHPHPWHPPNVRHCCPGVSHLLLTDGTIPKNIHRPAAIDSEATTVTTALNAKPSFDLTISILAKT